MNYPDTFYHVLSRANDKRDVFHSKDDYEKFKETIGRMVGRYDMVVHGYVLMRNHYHLLIRTKQANLSRAIQWLGLTYSMWFNRRYARSGHLFQGRFKSFVIENDRYFTSMCLYIHRNPIRAGIAKSLFDYQWSSYPAYVIKEKAKEEPWLTKSLVLGMYGGSRKRFVEAQLSYANEEESLLADLKHGLYLGSESFVEEWKERLEWERHREKPQVRLALRDQDISSIVKMVFLKLGVEDAAMFLKPLRRVNRPNRDLAIYILCHLGIYSHQEIGRIFGVGYTSITGALTRARSYMDTEEKVRKKVSKILNDI